jgi:hypothetical protein
MSQRDLKGKSALLREAMPREKAREAPKEEGKRLGVLRRDGEELRIVWSEYEGRPYLSLRIWTKGTNGAFYPDKARGFTVRLRELPDFADAIQGALEEADDYYAEFRKGKEEEARRNPSIRRESTAPTGRTLNPLPKSQALPQENDAPSLPEDDSEFF